MSNSYFNFTAGQNLVPNTLGRASVVNALFNAVAAGFDGVQTDGFNAALPAQTGNADKWARTDGTDTVWSHFYDVVYPITDGASVVLDPALGGIQTWTLGANRTATTDFAAGESMMLMVNDGTARTLTITGVTWVGSLAPTLSLTLYTVIQLWKVGSTVYGLGVGDA